MAREAWYELMIRVEPGTGNHGSEWQTATRPSVMSKDCAEGLLANYGAEYHAQLFRGYNIGRLVGEKCPTNPKIPKGEHSALSARGV